VRFKGLDLNHLATLDVLLSERSLTRAGELIHISQPAVSNALARLREHFHDELLVRRGRDMALTPFAENLRASLHLSLDHIRRVALARPDFDPMTHTRHFTIMSSDYFAVAFLPRILTQLRLTAPGITLSHVPILPSGMEMFDRGEIDIVVMPEGGLTFSRHPFDLLFVEEFIFIASASNNDIGSIMTEEHYRSSPRVMPPFAQFVVDRCWPAAKVLRDEPQSQLPFTAIPFLVAQSDVISIIPKRLADMYGAFLPLKQMQPDAAPFLISYIIQLHREKQDEPGLRWLIEIVETAARNAAFA